MKRIAKDPDGKDGFPGSRGGSGPCNNNQQCLNHLMASLTDRREITYALLYRKTSEGLGFWSDYYVGISSIEDVIDNINHYINILAIPEKPFVKEDWH